MFKLENLLFISLIVSFFFLCYLFFKSCFFLLFVIPLILSYLCLLFPLPFPCFFSLFSLPLLCCLSLVISFWFLSLLYLNSPFFAFISLLSLLCLYLVSFFVLSITLSSFLSLLPLAPLCPPFLFISLLFFLVPFSSISHNYLSTTFVINTIP